MASGNDRNREREGRLAEALRANLKRRKAQQRGLTDEPVNPSAAEDVAGGGGSPPPPPAGTD